MPKIFIIIFLAVFTLSAVTFSWAAAPADSVSVRLVLPTTKFEPGKSYPLLLEISMEPGYHINSNEPSDPALIPTRASFSVSDERVTIGRVVYPRADLKKFRFSRKKVAVFEGTQYISTSLSFSDGITEPVTIKALLDYQACTDTVCFLPTQTETFASLETGSGGEPINQEAFKKVGGAEKGGSVMAEFEASSGIGLLLLVFLGGLALNLTPCVYPLIPVTIGFFGAYSGRARSRILLHAFIYLFGIAVMYSLLGTFAAITGSLFGELMQNVLVIMLLVLVMLLLAFSMFGFYEIKVPPFLLRFSSKSYGGLFGTFFMGVTVGIIAAPCVGPFVIGLLTFVGERQDPLLGFTLFFVLALGLGLPFVVLAVFSGGIQHLPKSGEWMEWVKRLFGVVLLGMALYFALPLIPPDFHGTLSTILALAGAVYLLWSGRGIGGKVFSVFRFAVPSGMIISAFLFMIAGTAEKDTLHFAEYSKAVFEESVKSGKPVVLYFTADWCVPCRELELFTFRDEEVLIRSSEFTPLKVDLTHRDERNTGFKNEFGVKGVPTIIVFGKDGIERRRFTGFITAEEFLQFL